LVTVLAIRLLLVVLLVLCVVFAWRAWNRSPGIAALAAGAATFLGIFLLRHPALAAFGLFLSLFFIAQVSRPRK
jgi:hypothetical protein